MNASTSNRQARLALALRENLKRRKRQTRERDRETRDVPVMIKANEQAGIEDEDLPGVDAPPSDDERA